MRARVGTTVSDQGRVVLAAGTESGHAHEVVAAAAAAADAAAGDADARPAAQLFEEPDGKRYLVVERTCVLMHAEHAPIAVAPGCYRVTIQREYEPEGIRYVLD
jgi:predicted transcriptional regulator